MRGFRHRATVAAALAAALDGVAPLARRGGAPRRGRRTGGGGPGGRPTVDVPAFRRATMDGYAVRAADTFGASAYNPVALAVDRRGDAGPAGRRAGGPGDRLAHHDRGPAARGGRRRPAAPRTPTRAAAGWRCGRRSPEGATWAGWARTCAAATRWSPPAGACCPRTSACSPAWAGPWSRCTAGPGCAWSSRATSCCPPESAPTGTRIADSNGPMLAALVARDGGVVEESLRLPDDPEAMRAALSRPGADVDRHRRGGLGGPGGLGAAARRRTGTAARSTGWPCAPPPPPGSAASGGSRCSCSRATRCPAWWPTTSSPGRSSAPWAGGPPTCPTRWPPSPSPGAWCPRSGAPTTPGCGCAPAGSSPLPSAGPRSSPRWPAADGFVIVPSGSEGFPEGHPVEVHLYRPRGGAGRETAPVPRRRGRGRGPPPLRRRLRPPRPGAGGGSPRPGPRAGAGRRRLLPGRRPRLRPRQRGRLRRAGHRHLRRRGTAPGPPAGDRPLPGRRAGAAAGFRGGPGPGRAHRHRRGGAPRRRRRGHGRGHRPRRGRRRGAAPGGPRGPGHLRRVRHRPRRPGAAPPPGAHLPGDRGPGRHRGRPGPGVAPPPGGGALHRRRDRPPGAPLQVGQVYDSNQRILLDAVAELGGEPMAGRGAARRRRPASRPPSRPGSPGPGPPTSSSSPAAPPRARGTSTPPWCTAWPGASPGRPGWWCTAWPSSRASPSCWRSSPGSRWWCSPASRPRPSSPSTSSSPPWCAAWPGGTEEEAARGRGGGARSASPPCPAAPSTCWSTWCEGPAGLAAYPLGAGSGSVTALARADGFVRIPAATEYVAAGDRVTVRLLHRGCAPPTWSPSAATAWASTSSSACSPNGAWRSSRSRWAPPPDWPPWPAAKATWPAIHLLDEATGEYNRPFLPPGVGLVRGYGRRQGVAFRRGDPDLDVPDLDAFLGGGAPRRAHDGEPQPGERHPGAPRPSPRRRSVPTATPTSRAPTTPWPPPWRRGGPTGG